MEILTYNDCSSIIKNISGNNSEIVEYSISGPVSSQVLGIMGDHLRLEIVVRCKIKNIFKIKKLQFFVKTMPKSHGSSELIEFIKKIGVFEKEQLLFGELFPKLNKFSSAPWTAKCYAYKIDGVLVLEDLNLKNFTLMEPVQFIDFVHAVSLIKTLARFHASSLALEEYSGNRAVILEKFCKGMLNETRYSKDKTSPQYKRMYAGLKSVITMLKLMGWYQEGHMQQLIRVADEMCDLVQPSVKYRNAIGHGDLWFNNVMFRYNQNGTVDSLLIDFQMSRYSLPAYDFLLFIYLSTNKQFRSLHLSELVSIYYKTMTDELARHGIDISKVLPLSELDETLEICKPSVIFDSALIASTVKLSSDNKKNILSNDEAYSKYTYRDRTELVTEAFEEDGSYREKLTDILTELIEHTLK